MRKVLIASATVFAIVASAGTAMAGPLRDHGQHGFARASHMSSSQAIGHIAKEGKTRQATSMGISGATSMSDYDHQESQTSTQQTATYGSSGGSQLPNVVVVPVHENGNYTLIFGNASGSDLASYPVYYRYR